jgi:hypothetical protein
MVNDTMTQSEYRKLTIGDLIKAFRMVGMPVSASWIRRQEDKGNLILPRSTTNFKMAQGARRPGAVRQMSEKQIIDILKAFLPEGMKLPNGEFANGKGYYSYKNNQ